MRVIQKKHRSSDGLKYSHAYDEFESLISIKQALKLSKRKYYLTRNKEVEMIISAINSTQITPHFKTLSNQKITLKNGKVENYSRNKDPESFEHKQAKGNIAERNYFFYKHTKVYIKDSKIEYSYFNNQFRSDVYAKLLDDNDVMIEVIKTSDISKRKQLAINKNQILTFKIYIDDNGNQIVDRDRVIGNAKIEEINSRIQRGEGKLAELRDDVERITRKINRQYGYNKYY